VALGRAVVRIRFLKKFQRLFAQFRIIIGKLGLSEPEHQIRVVLVDAGQSGLIMLDRISVTAILDELLRQMPGGIDASGHIVLKLPLP
jgi:hypothetical protein